MNLHILCLMGALLVTCSHPAMGQPKSEFDLENGLHVILKPLPSAKNTALVMLYSVGNRHDPPGRSGMAHLAEHLYVTAATETKAARTAQQYVKEYPDGWNAQTGDTYTVIATVFEPGRFKEELSDAANRIRSLRVAQADLDRELPRMDEELTNMYGGMIRLAAQNWGRHHAQPLAHGGRRGGIAAQIASIRVPEVQIWLDRFYNPNNAVLVAVGPFDLAEARNHIMQKFGNIKRGERPVIHALPEPDVERVHQVAAVPRGQGERVRVLLAFSVPDPHDSLYPAFLVQAAKLQTNSRRLANDVRTFPVAYMPVDLPETMFVTLPVVKETPEAVINKLQLFVNEQTTQGLAAADSVRTKNAFGFLLGLTRLPDAILANNPYGVAFSLGRRNQLGINASELSAAIERVDDAQLQKVATTVFSLKRCTTIIARAE